MMCHRRFLAQGLPCRILRVRGEIIEARAKRRNEIGETRRNRSRLSLAKGKAAKCSPGQGAFTNMFSHYFHVQSGDVSFHTNQMLLDKNHKFLYITQVT